MRPFFSYTRTQDGASLITDVEAIRYLFPDANNGGVLCGDEIGFADESEAEEENEYGGEHQDEGEDDYGEETDVDEALEVRAGGDARVVSHFDPPEHNTSASEQPHAHEQSPAWPGSPHFEDVKTPPPPSYIARRELDLGHHRSHSAPTAFGRPAMRVWSSGNSAKTHAAGETETKRKGRKLCLQLDLSTVKADQDGTYHLGE
jgi:hypothetical protein